MAQPPSSACIPTRCATGSNDSGLYAPRETAMNRCGILDVIKRTAGYRERAELFPAITSALRDVVDADYYALLLRDHRDAVTFYSYVEPPVQPISNRMSDYFAPLAQSDGRVIIVHPEHIAG